MEPRYCRICGCSDFEPCVDFLTGEGCSWVEPDLCSACVDEELPAVVVDGGFQRKEGSGLWLPT